ncbi:hypothetical protein [Ruegeria sp. HKCCD7221]|uniref:hypothetical protein n=1 Tax=Ruegeria sp. HKCCD7221 TaxID=2683009 RepID=UPI001488DC26|nr:hypothetical protein [Ruegeria sp. HKCCD7221]
MKPVVDWNDIHTSVMNALGEHRVGWADQLALVLEDVKRSVAQHPDVFGDELPVIVQIKQKLGGLRVYTRECNRNIFGELETRVEEIEKTCERCGNSAEIQNVRGYLVTLCCWCYNSYLEDRFEDAEARWPTDLELNVADRFPDLVSADTASLWPSVGPGRLVLLGRFLAEAEHLVRENSETPIQVQISDVKTGPDGSIQVSFSRYDQCLDLLLKRVQLDSKRTCARCGHVGDIVRKKHRATALCAHCQEQGDWNPFDE